jgi:hypothetical protein
VVMVSGHLELDMSRFTSASANPETAVDRQRRIA